MSDDTASREDVTAAMRSAAEVLRDIADRLRGRRTVDPRAVALIGAHLDDAARVIELDEARIVYRAYYETVPLGLYTTRGAARTHCLSDAADHGDDITGARWVPVDDAEDDPEGLSEECLEYRRPGEVDFGTEYSVMPLIVATAYDPEAED